MVQSSLKEDEVKLSRIYCHSNNMHNIQGNKTMFAQDTGATTAELNTIQLKLD